MTTRKPITASTAISRTRTAVRRKDKPSSSPIGPPPGEAGGGVAGAVIVGPPCPWLDQLDLLRGHRGGDSATGLRLDLRPRLGPHPAREPERGTVGRQANG